MISSAFLSATGKPERVAPDQNTLNLLALLENVTHRHVVLTRHLRSAQRLKVCRKQLGQSVVLVWA